MVGTVTLCLYTEEHTELCTDYEYRDDILVGLCSSIKKEEKTSEECSTHWKVTDTLENQALSCIEVKFKFNYMSDDASCIFHVRSRFSVTAPSSYIHMTWVQRKKQQQLIACS